MLAGISFRHRGAEGVGAMKKGRLNNLEMEMKSKGISRKDIAELLGLTYRTIHSRFNGASDWTFPECVKVRDTYFPGKDLEWLFSIEEK